jgi:hypothetical protein
MTHEKRHENSADPVHFPVPRLPGWSLEASNGRERPRKMMGEDGMVTYKINKKRGGTTR